MARKTDGQLTSVDLQGHPKAEMGVDLSGGFPERPPRSSNGRRKDSPQSWSRGLLEQKTQPCAKAGKSLKQLLVGAVQGVTSAPHLLGRTSRHGRSRKSLL